VSVRRATTADARLMRELWDAFTAEATFTPYPGMPFADSLLTDHVALLAEEDGRLPVLSTRTSARFGYVFLRGETALLVTRASRGRSG
jgi:hypothetical protein